MRRLNRAGWIAGVAALGISAAFLLRPRYDAVWNAREALPEAVNLPGVEACEPNFTPDGRALIFTRGSAGKNTDLYRVDVGSDGTPTGDSTPLRGVNTEFDEIDGMLGRDGVLYFYSDRPGGLGAYDLYAARGQPDGSYEPATNLGASVNSEYNDYDPCLSPDGKFLYFSSNRHSAGSEEDYDLYVCLRTESGWSAPRALAGLNTPANEWEPMLTRKGRQLYFTSNRPTTNGVVRTDYELYAASLAKSEGWGTVVNLGTELNSGYDEFDPAVHPRSDALLFVRGIRNDTAYDVRVWNAALRRIPLGPIVRLDRFPRAALLALAALAAALVLLVLLVAGWHRLSTLQRCLLASLAAHCLAAWVLTMVALKAKFEELQRSDASVAVYTDLPEDVAQDVLLAALFRDEQEIKVSKAPEPELASRQPPSPTRLEAPPPTLPEPQPTSQPSVPAVERPLQALPDLPTTVADPVRMPDAQEPSPEPPARPPDRQAVERQAPVFTASPAELSAPAPSTTVKSRPTEVRDPVAPMAVGEVPRAVSAAASPTLEPASPGAPAPPRATDAARPAPRAVFELSAAALAWPDLPTTGYRPESPRRQAALHTLQTGETETQLAALPVTAGEPSAAPTLDAPKGPVTPAVPRGPLVVPNAGPAGTAAALSPPRPSLTAARAPAEPRKGMATTAFDWMSHPPAKPSAALTAAPTESALPVAVAAPAPPRPRPTPASAPSTVPPPVLAAYRPAATLPAPTPSVGVSRRIAPRERIARIEWGRPENLGPTINQGGETYEPNLSADGRTLFFTHGAAGGEANLLRSERTAQGWTTPEPLKALNGEFDDIDSTVDGEGQTLLFYSNRPEGQGGYDLFLSRRGDDGEWTAPTNLGTRVNSEWNDYDPHLSRDGRRLFFSSNRQSQGSEEDYDLYLCERLEDGQWSPPQRLAISTSANEWEPALSPDGLSLYFCSNRPGGKGGYDLWVSHRRDAQWQPPAPLDGGVNSEADELDPAVTPDGETLFFVSNRKGAHGTFDIWQAKRSLVE